MLALDAYMHPYMPMYGLPLQLLHRHAIFPCYICFEHITKLMRAATDNLLLRKLLLVRAATDNLLLRKLLQVHTKSHKQGGCTGTRGMTNPPQGYIVTASETAALESLESL